MKQVLQSLRTGEIEVAEVPVPALRSGCLLIKTRKTLLSVGTERMMVDFGKAGWIDKARQQPDKVRQVIQKARTDGVLPTLAAVRQKLDQPLALGYCNVGEVIGVGAGVNGFAVGDLVASNGKHAAFVTVPVNLCARLPMNVSEESAAFTVVGAIGLQAVRLVNPTLGECFVVSGLGLIGLITVQILRAHGCRVLGLDFDPAKLALAKSLGAEVLNLSSGVDPVAVAQDFSRGRGVDGVLVAAATDSSEPIHQAALMCRKRGRIVLVGVTGLNLSRADFFEKELTFQVSCSYGPGRYDLEYEEMGRDYPVGFVRWTEQRNFEAVLDLMADGALTVERLITHRVPIDQAQSAYELVGSDSNSLGILLEYPQQLTESLAADRTVGLSEGHGTVTSAKAAPGTSSMPGRLVEVGFIGAGNYATAVLIPAFKSAGARLSMVASNNGVTGLHAGRKFGFAQTTSDVGAVLADTQTNSVVIATRHDSHADLVCKSLAAGKNVFVEKPMAIDLASLEQIQAQLARIKSVGRLPVLTVGFNRRFSPHVTRLKELLAANKLPKVMIMTVNAGEIPATHWTQNAEIGGGRIIGEACHFIDLLRHLAGAPIVSWNAQRVGSALGDSPQRIDDDKATITLQFADGSLGTIHYLANGHKSFPKERLEVFSAGRIMQLDNFRAMRGYGWSGFTRQRLWRQDKGQNACAAAFVRAVAEGNEWPIPLDELIEVSRVSIEIAQALAKRKLKCRTR